MISWKGSQAGKQIEHIENDFVNLLTLDGNFWQVAKECNKFFIEQKGRRIK